MKHDSPYAMDTAAPSVTSLVALALCYPVVLGLSYVLKPSVPVDAVFLAPNALIFAALRLVPLRQWAPVIVTVCALDCLVMSVVPGAAMGALELSQIFIISLANQLTVVGMVAASEAIRRVRFLRRRFLVMMPLLIIALGVGAAPGVVVTAWIDALNANLPLTPIDVAARLLGCVLGVVVCCPLLFGLIRGFREPAPPAAGRGEVMAILLAFIVLGLYLLLVRWPLSDRFTELIFLALPLFWLAMRGTRRSVAIAVASLAVVIAFASAHGLGAFAPLVEAGRWNDRVVSTQIFLLLVSCETLLINRAMLERGALLEKYRRKQTQLASYAEALNKADELARRAAAADLHDGVGQILAGQGLILGSMRGLAQVGSPLGAMLDQALAASHEAQSAVRHTIQDLYPPELDGASITQLLTSIARLFATRYSFHVNWSVDGDAQPDRFRPELLYRIIKELTYNAYKHARTHEVSVAVVVRPAEIEASVFDRGVGFGNAEASAALGGFGLLSMTERVQAAGGRVVVESAVGAGCRVSVWLPLMGVETWDTGPAPAAVRSAVAYQPF